MATRHFFLNKRFVLLLSLVKCFGVATKETTSGPYKASIVDVKDCEKPLHPYIPDPPISVKMKMTNTTDKVLVGGNVTVSAEVPNVKYRVKSFIWENGKWAPYLIMNDIGCHGMLLHVICETIGIKYDRKKCMFMKGQYYLKDFDVNPLLHIRSSKIEYGKMIWRSELYSSTGTFYCLEFFIMTEPA